MPMLDWIGDIDLPTIASGISYGISAIVSAYWLALSRRPPRKSGSSLSDLPPVSVLIPAHDAESALRKLLAMLAQEAYPAPWEVIVALDRCTDGSEGVVEEFIGRLPLRWIRISETPAGWTPKKYALWRATETARHDWCIVLDADTEIPKAWLSQMMGAAAGSVAVIGHAWLRGSGSLGSRLAAYEAALVQLESVGRARWGFPYMSTGRGWAVRRAWLRGGLFLWREVLSGDDDLTFQLLPKSLIRVAPTYTISAAPPTLLAALRRKWRHLQTARFYSLSLRISLASVPFLQMLLFFTAYWAPMSLLFPPIAKALALWRVGAPQAWVAIWADWLLIALQLLYPLGTWIKRSRW